MLKTLNFELITFFILQAEIIDFFFKHERDEVIYETQQEQANPK
jgi:uncharacterized membrane protein YkgB